ncbi:hypothetical protein LP419_03525 [Massilia sp. H-1]|nr:hypothetical protein LP419_03525 [Massilia sp. H-1]
MVDLMLARLQQLPYGALELVKLLACLGLDAPLATIAQAAKHERARSGRRLVA